LTTAAPESALIERLKARHRTQQQKFQELALRSERTRKDRRLRDTVLLLVAAALAVLVLVFHGRIHSRLHSRFFPYRQAPAPAAPTTGDPRR
jgi:hypothetical protein